MASVLASSSDDSALAAGRFFLLTGVLTSLIRLRPPTKKKSNTHLQSPYEENHIGMR